MNKFFILIVFLFFATACNNTATEKGKDDKQTKTSEEWLCIPKQQVGKITATSTEADLKKLYGEKNVVRDSISVGEGEYITGTTIFPKSPNALAIAWKKGREFEEIARIIVKEKSTKWATDKGITVGSSLQEVVKQNGRDFSFMGFEWDYYGTVASWEDGVFEKKGFGVRFNYEADISKMNMEEVGKVLGNHEVSTNEPILKQLDVQVEQMFFFF